MIPINEYKDKFVLFSIDPKEWDGIDHIKDIVINNNIMTIGYWIFGLTIHEGFKEFHEVFSMNIDFKKSFDYNIKRLIKKSKRIKK